MASNPVVLILGSGPRVGAEVAQKFASKGYNIALASRQGTNAKDKDAFLSLQADFANPETIPGLFEKVKQEFKGSPSVVVFNACAYTLPSDKNNIFSIPATSVASDLNVNVVSAYVAAQEAVKGFATLAPEVKKAFIYTGNILNTEVWSVPLLFNPGIGKAGAAYWVGAADLLSKGEGYRFFYADERFPDGKAKVNQIDGEAHGDFYAQLVDDGEDIPWHATFVKDKGYVRFH